MHQHAQFADLVDVLAVDLDIVDRLGDSRKGDAQNQAPGFRREARGLIDRSMGLRPVRFDGCNLPTGQSPVLLSTTR
jgi:hypothetical protein